MSTQFLSIVLSVLVFLFVVELVRRERLTFKYAAGWLLLSLAAICFAVFDRVLYALSGLLGFALTSNFIFFAVLCSFVVLSLLLTIFLCQQNDCNDRIAQKIGIMEKRLLDLEKQPPGRHNKKDS